MAKLPEKAACTAAVACATGALACAAGCVLPFALPAVVLAGSGSILAWLAGAYVWMTGLSVFIIASAWAWIGWQSVRSKARPALSTLSMMGIATAILILAVLWPRFMEPQLLQALAG